MKTALITGASSGIGLELARIFAREGHRVVLVARSAAALEKLKTDLEQQYRTEAVVLPADLSRTEAPQAVFEAVQARGLTVDFLVNNAGFGEFGLFAENAWDKENQMLDLNIRALTHLTKLFLPGMLARRSGRIMQLASTAAFQPGPLMAVYYATKAYVLSFSEAIANELQGTGVTVTALCPGPTTSGFQDAASLNDSKLVKGKKLPSSAEVAEYGYQALLRGQTVAVHGTMNWLMAQSVRFTPRKLVTALVRRMSERAQ
ncbi:SDR family NAD(P)-dependent oxidoreductase [Hymenobacter weizhouensis]|uniref:SDR family NAD(P)-dependent oxidoreductase n=1 Tax=Hymenobacter sp. YIM 151500-1 TaxID=2987689 RepID=UPI00222708C4|nr:SDR family oxidoreductase [Hymenobacter sp. YIM 151500-1]UYZ63718.1 SDR family oxidoreductase [Hymenobacter sp. YIM 151500-1]